MRNANPAKEARARRIRVARAELGIDQTTVASLAGIDQATVSKAEKGRGSDNIFDRIDAALAEARQR